MSIFWQELSALANTNRVGKLWNDCFRLNGFAFEEFVLFTLLEQKEQLSAHWFRIGTGMRKYGVRCFRVVFPADWASPTTCVIGMRKPVLITDALFGDD